MDKQNLILNMFFTIVLIIGWIGILLVSFIVFLLSDMVKFLGNGILVYTTVLIYLLTFALPVILRKRISKHISLPVSFVVFTILSVIVVGCILGGVKNYISDFSREKWSSYEMLRKYMIDDLEQNHEIIGKTDKEIVDLLGEPIYISDNPCVKYEYYIGEGIIDPYGYQIEFENNIAVNTSLFEH